MNKREQLNNYTTSMEDIVRSFNDKAATLCISITIAPTGIGDDSDVTVKGASYMFNNDAANRLMMAVIDTIKIMSEEQGAHVCE